jgi:tryptophan-rich sensory protein
MDEKQTNYFFIILIVIIIALVGSYITNQNLRSWYFSNRVQRSPFSPSPVIFGIVWTILYIFYAWAWCIAYKKSGYEYYLVFAISIVLNLLWVVFFFGMQNLVMSRMVIILLLIVVFYQAYIMWKLDSDLGLAFMLLYALWLICATGLNFTTSIKCQ